jgi:hypothetical protein
MHGFTSQGTELPASNIILVMPVMGLERVPLSLVNKIEELLGRNRSGSGL